MAAAFEGDEGQIEGEGPHTGGDGEGMPGAAPADAPSYPDYFAAPASTTATTTSSITPGASVEDDSKSTHNSNETDEALQSEMKIDVSAYDEDIKQLVKKYYLFHKHNKIKQQLSLSQVSPHGAPHESIKSFAFIPDNVPIVLVMGETGTGKSSLCNKIAGIYYKFEESIDEDGDPLVKITCEGQNELFTAKTSANGVTQNSAWAQAAFLQNAEKQLVILDTPGLNDANKEQSIQHRTDLLAKLAALHRIDTILIVFDDLGRFKQSHVDMLLDITSLFANNENFFDHFAVAVTNCDESDKRWKNSIKQRKKDFREKIKKEIFTKDINIPIFTFSSIQDERNIDPESGSKTWSQQSEFNRFYDFCVESSKNTLLTGDYMLVQKLDDKIKQLKQNNSYISHSGALNYLVTEMVSERKRLDEIYKKNATYLANVPKNALEGLACCGKNMIAATFFLGLDDKTQQRFQGACNGQTEEKNEDSSMASKPDVMSSIGNVVSKSLSSLSTASKVARSGLNSIWRGATSTIKTHEEQVAKLEQDRQKKHKEVLSNVLDGKETRLQREVSLEDEMFAKYIGTGDEIWKETIDSIVTG